EDIRDATVVPPRPASPPGPVGGQGRIITVWGTGSSPGRTLTAVNLADQACRQGHRSVLVDADTVPGMVAATPGLTEGASHRPRRGRAGGRGGSSRWGGRDRRRGGPSRRSTSPTRPGGRAPAACSSMPTPSREWSLPLSG